MFNFFKSKTKASEEAMREIPIGIITLALEEHGQSIGDYENSDQFCRKASIAFGKVIAEELQQKNGSIDSDDLFTIGVFVMGATNYITATLNIEFEKNCMFTLLDYYRDIDSGDPGVLGGDTINAFNDLMSGGDAGHALMVQIANFFEHSGEAHLARLMKLYEVFRGGLG